MGDVIDFRAERGKRFVRRLEELRREGHVPAAALHIAMTEFGLEPAPTSPPRMIRAFLGVE